MKNGRKSFCCAHKKNCRPVVLQPHFIICVSIGYYKNKVKSCSTKFIMDPSRNNNYGLPNNRVPPNGRSQLPPGFPYGGLQGTQNHNPHQAMNRDLNLQGLLQRQMNPYQQQRGSYSQAHQNDLLHALGNQQHQGHGMNHTNSLIQQLQHQQFQNQQSLNGIRQQQANFGLSAYDDIRQQFEQKMQQIRDEQERERQKQQHKQQIQQHLQKLQQQQQEQKRQKNPMALLQEDYERRKQKELEEQQAKKFHEFLLSKTNEISSPRVDASLPEEQTSSNNVNKASSLKTENEHDNGSGTSPNDKGLQNPPLEDKERDLKRKSNEEEKEIRVTEIQSKRHKVDVNKGDSRVSEDVDINDSDGVEFVRANIAKVINHANKNNIDDKSKLKEGINQTDDTDALLDYEDSGRESEGDVSGADDKESLKKDDPNTLDSSNTLNESDEAQIEVGHTLHILAEATVNRSIIEKSNAPDTTDLFAKMIGFESNYVDREQGHDGVVDDIMSRLPQLPSEPNYLDPAENSQFTGPVIECLPEEDVPLNVDRPVFLKAKDADLEEPLYYSPVDPWYPENYEIVKAGGKEFKNNSTQTTVTLPSGKLFQVPTAMHKRLSNSSEPGVLEKIPHCMIHARKYQAQFGKLSKEPLFCFQVTEVYCNNVMVCCSKCSTWRHVECGGHYTYKSPRSSKDAFMPVCDRCHEEELFLTMYPQARKRISIQRDIQIRKTNVLGDIMRHAAYAKHGGTYKWPLGSVAPSHILSHAKSVQIRNERSEKQWKEMLSKIDLSSKSKSRDKLKHRTKEMERILNNLEEAEGKTDRHNMILFLERDTDKRYPAGFENPQLNFFDPEDDPIRTAARKDMKSGIEPKNLLLEDCSDHDTDEEDNDSKQNGEGEEDNERFATTSGTSTIGRTFSTVSNKKKSPVKDKCLRHGCTRKPRFDSSFCSDACGISDMEKDLLRSLTFANNMHPFYLRN